MLRKKSAVPFYFAAEARNYATAANFPLSTGLKEMEFLLFQ